MRLRYLKRGRQLSLTLPNKLSKRANISPNHQISPSIEVTRSTSLRLIMSKPMSAGFVGSNSKKPQKVGGQVEEGIKHSEGVLHAR